MEQAERRFTALRDELIASLIQSPTEQNPESIQRMVEMPLPLVRKYQEIDVKGIVQGNAQGEILRGLRTLSIALNILEKYGRNLLTPLKPRFWRMVKFNNPVFRDTVDTIKGGRDILRLYGYSEEQGDGLCFPEHLLEPDVAHVASVTVDIMLLRAELNLLLSEAHPNPLAFQDLIQGCDNLQATTGFALPDPGFPARRGLSQMAHKTVAPSFSKVHD